MLSRIVSVMAKQASGQSVRRVTSCQLLEYAKYGEPLDILKLVTRELPDIGPKDVLYKVIASPINPADVLTLQGIYPVQPPLPAVGGMEGVVRIEQVGSGVSELQPGDLAIPCPPALGLWRTAGVTNADNLIKVPKDLNPMAAAILTVNPPTAYRMLKNYVQLEPGDTVLQSGGASVVGQLIIQLCKIFKLVSVSTIRDDKTKEQAVKDKLKQLGADVVMTQSEFKEKAKSLFQSIPRPKLAIDCIAGTDTVTMVESMAKSGVIINYGAMSMQPMHMPPLPFIFNDINLRGFWLVNWNEDPANHHDRLKITAHLASMYISGELKIPEFEEVNFENYHKAFEDLKAGRGVKKILKFA